MTMPAIKPLVLTAFLTSHAQAAIVTLPFSEDFTDTSKTSAAAFGFTTSVAGFGTIGGSGANRYMQALIAASQNGSLSVGYADPGPYDFTVSTNVLPYLVDPVGDTDATFLRFALIAAGGTDNFTNSTSNYRLSIDFVAGTIGLLKGADSLGASFTGNLPALAQSTALSMSLTGTYLSPTSVFLTGEVSDGINTYTLTYTDTSALTGGNFGILSNKNGTGGSTGDRTQLGVRVGDFLLDVVPEPSSALLGATGLSVFLVRRRRQA